MASGRPIVFLDPFAHRTHYASEGLEAIQPAPRELFRFSLFRITQILKAMSKFRVRGLNPNPADPLFFPHSASQGMQYYSPGS